MVFEGVQKSTGTWARAPMPVVSFRLANSDVNVALAVPAAMLA